jgi:hypothetical protein
MTEALRLRKLRLRLSPPVAVERSPLEWVFVQHLPEHYPFHRDVAPTVEVEPVAFSIPLPLADLSELSCLEEVIRYTPRLFWDCAPGVCIGGDDWLDCFRLWPVAFVISGWI